MKSEELINALKEIIHCYEAVNDPESPSHREINMWRERFLKENLTEEHKKKNPLAAHYFYATPCNDLMKKGPDEWFKICLKLPERD